MILTAHQPVYLPWLGLFHKIALADAFVFFDQVQYVPKDYISRNSVKTNTGPTLLTVPVYTKGYLDKTIAQMEINNESERWAEKHWKTILLNYKKAPYFNLYAGFFEDLYKKEWKLLADLNYYMLTWLLQQLGIKIPVLKAGDYTFKGSKSDLVLDMCLTLKANTYIFGKLGEDYADVQKFKERGVTPVFQQYNHPTYKQLYKDFIPNMSVIDLMFNEGPASLEIIMSGNIKTVAK